MPQMELITVKRNTRPCGVLLINKTCGCSSSAGIRIHNKTHSELIDHCVITWVRVQFHLQVLMMMLLRMRYSRIIINREMYRSRCSAPVTTMITQKWASLSWAPCNDPLRHLTNVMEKDPVRIKWLPGHQRYCLLCKEDFRSVKQMAK